MRILMTNSTLDFRAGAELVLLDLAAALLRRGHSPVAYSTRLGPVAEELRKATIPVVDDLTACPWRPDIIHGHHQVETMTAMLAFPGVPGVSVCHGWLPWDDTPVHFPRIARWVAVDDTCRDRLVVEHGMPEAQVRVFLNFVDLERFRPRAPLPARPTRALLFSNYVREEVHLAPLREACQRSGVALDAVGLSLGNPHAQPELLLGQYDVVFAKGRAAIEALAVGAAVVVCDRERIGEMVTTENYARLRRLNFGVRSMDRPIHVDRLAEAIARYDAADAAAVTRRIRAEAGLEAAADAWVRLYEEVLAAPPATDPQDELRAASAYLRRLTPRLKDYWRMGEENLVLRRAYDAVRQQLDAQPQALRQAQERIRALEAQLTP